MSQYEVVCYQPEPHYFNGSFPRLFKVQNTTGSALPATRISIVTDTYYGFSNEAVPALGPYQSATVWLTVNIRGGRTVDHVPSSLVVAVGNEKHSFCPTMCK